MEEAEFDDSPLVQIPVPRQVIKKVVLNINITFFFLHTPT